MKTTQIHLLLLALSATTIMSGSSASADNAGWHPHRHPVIVDTPIDPLVLETGPCVLAVPLALGKVCHSYPLLGGKEFEVEIWKAVYTREDRVQEQTRRDIYDGRDGTLLRTEIIPGRTCDHTSYYPIDNPNLHDDVAMTFELVPMTDSEAQAALATALQDCQKPSTPAPTNQ